MSHRRARLTPIFLILLSVLTLGFAWHALSTGIGGVRAPEISLGRLYAPSGMFTNLAISAHMIAGAAITVLAPLQMIQALRIRWPRLHRSVGHVLIALALLTAVNGLIYMVGRGTVGGPLMTIGFTLYGGLMILSAVQALRFARSRDIAAHRRWAVRLFVLAIGSWLYRVHYGIWYALTGGMASTADFTGLFDQIQVFAFYLPYLVLAEIVLRRTAPPVAQGSINPKRHVAR